MSHIFFNVFVFLSSNACLMTLYISSLCPISLTLGFDRESIELAYRIQQQLSVTENQFPTQINAMPQNTDKD